MQPRIGQAPGAPRSPRRYVIVNATFHIVGCAIAAPPDAGAIDECVQWIRRYGGEVLSHDERRLVFVQFDAAGTQVILFGCRSALAHRPPRLRFGFASAVKEAGADGRPRAGDRGVAQACDLADGALPGQTLLSSQLGTLLEMARAEPYQRLRPMRLRLPAGRTAAAYAVEPLRAASAAPGTPQ